MKNNDIYATFDTDAAQFLSSYGFDWCHAAILGVLTNIDGIVNELRNTAVMDDKLRRCNV